MNAKTSGQLVENEPKENIWVDDESDEDNLVETNKDDYEFYDTDDEIDEDYTKEYAEDEYGNDEDESQDEIINFKDNESGAAVESECLSDLEDADGIPVIDSVVKTSPTVIDELYEFAAQDEKVNLLTGVSFLITAELGQVSFTLQQLLNLQVGDVFDVATLPVKVKLMTHGLYLGDGHLVEINGRVGVKISKLSSNYGTLCAN